jgi:UDP-glucose 4-epimerase
MTDKILVTGAAGFIGSNLCEELLIGGHEVIGVDNLSSGTKSNLLTLDLHKNFKFEPVDIFDLKSKKGRSLMKDVTVVYHLAAQKIPRYSNPLSTLKVNGIGSEIVFDVASENGCKIIAASTSDVYGKNPQIPFNENSDLVIGNPNVSRWAYAISKMFEEQLLFGYSALRKTPAVAVRFFGAYGPRQCLGWQGGPVPVFINNAIKSIPFEIHGNGNQTRSFTYILDHIRALVKLHSYEWQGAFHLNSGSNSEITVLELAKRIWEKIQPGREFTYELIPYTNFGDYEDVMRRVPDSSKAQTLLNIDFKTDLDCGLDLTIDWQRSIFNKDS